MLKQRLITAAVLMPFALWMVLFAPHQVFSLLLLGITSIAAYEWGKLGGLNVVSAAVYAFVLAALLFIADRSGLALPLGQIALGLSVIWLVLTLMLVFRSKPLVPVSGISVVSLLVGFVMLCGVWLFVNSIHAISTNGPAILMMMLVLIWIADSAAYFSGRFFGKNKLSVHVSPGKTWEGVLGAFLGAAVYGYLLSLHEFFAAVNPFLLSAMCIVVVFVSVGGDLFESKAKRERGVKDSGTILPGHGGIYDRIDSVVAAAPVFYLGLLLLSDGKLL